MTTETGKRLLASVVPPIGPLTLAAIEAEAKAEARATLLAELRKGVIGLFTDYFLGCGGYGCSDDRTRDTEAVLRLLDTAILANAGTEADRGRPATLAALAVISAAADHGVCTCDPDWAHIIAAIGRHERACDHDPVLRAALDAWKEATR